MSTLTPAARVLRALPLWLGLLCSPAATAVAPYQPLPGVAPIPVAAAPAVDAAEMEAVVDRLMRKQFETAYIAGAAVSVVKDGQILLSKGYGHADIDRGIPVNPKRTLFRMGSTAKIFTAAAVMQLVEQKRLELDADVNRYLSRFQIPETYPQPITLRNLLTHTAGLDVTAFGYIVSASADQIRPLDTVLPAHMPKRVRAPTTDFNRGEGAAYSNWGYALAGYIVSQRAGVSFDTYMDKYLLRPLGMHRSTFAEPLPADLSADMSIGYSGGDPFIAHPFAYFHNLAPAGSLTATPEDMARFMIAQLQPAGIENPRILSESMVTSMQSRALSPSPYVNGAGLGWMEHHHNGHRLLWHGGKTLYFYNELYLLPEQDLGFQVIYNTQPLGSMRGELMREIMNHFFPAELPKLEPTAQADAPDPATRNYAITVRSLATWEKLLTLGLATRITEHPNGVVTIPDPTAGGLAYWAPIGAIPETFRQQGRGVMMVRTPGPNGRNYLLGPEAFAPQEELSFWETPAFNLGLLLVFTGSFLLYLAGYWRARHQNDGVRMLRLSTAVIALTGLSVEACMLATLLTSPQSMLLALPWTLWAGLGLGLLMTVLIVIHALLVARAWHQTEPTRFRYVSEGAFLLLGLGFLGWMHFWNLLGFHIA